jgi:dTDP-glucose 4,6-dehydratase
MHVVITGGAGFLGSHLVDGLINQGRKVTVVDNLLTGSLGNLAQHADNRNFRFVHHDVSKRINIDGNVDSILHFASPASPVDYLSYPIQTLKVGSLGTHNALGLAREKGSRFLLASTSEVYGDPDVHPQSEKYWGRVNPVGPRGVYDEAKRFAEAITMAYHRVHGLDTRIARIFNTYGPRMRETDGRVVSNFIMQSLLGKPLTIYGNGRQTRSFCYVSDLVSGIIKLIDADAGETPVFPMAGQDDSKYFDVHSPVNLGNPCEFTILDLAQLVLSLTCGVSDLKFEDLPVDDPQVRQPDIGRAKSLLNWEPHVSLERGLSITIEDMRYRLGLSSV